MGPSRWVAAIAFQFDQVFELSPETLRALDAGVGDQDIEIRELFAHCLREVPDRHRVTIGGKNAICTSAPLPRCGRDTQTPSRSVAPTASAQLKGNWIWCTRVL